MTCEQIIWSPGCTLEQIERQVIEKAFAFFRQNKSATASALGICVKTLDAKCARYSEQDKIREENNAKERQLRENFLARCRGQPVPYPDVHPVHDEISVPVPLPPLKTRPSKRHSQMESTTP